MAHVLLGWEFGANRGHAQQLVQIASALAQARHRVSFAVKRRALFRPEAVQGARVWQAPTSPSRRDVPAEQRRPPSGMADILARLGFDDRKFVAAKIRAWRRLLDRIRPDLVVADYAPFLLLAMRSAIPTLAVGPGFLLPPADMAEFPALNPTMEGVDQAALLAGFNRGLADAGANALTALPAIFAASRAIPITFAELDPYAAQRRDALASPLPADFAARAGSGEEIFLYWPRPLSADSPLLRGLAAASLPVRAWLPEAPSALLRQAAKLGWAVESGPLPFARIAERSRMLISHGGHGFVCAGLAAGLPHVVVHGDLEKLLHGIALARLGLGGHVSIGSLLPEPFAASLIQLYRDESLAGRARSAAPGFRDRGQPSFTQAVAEAVASLA